MAVVPFVARPFLDLSINGHRDRLDRRGRRLVRRVLVLFVPPVVLLGMVTPFAIRIGVERHEKAGRAPAASSPSRPPAA